MKTFSSKEFDGSKFLQVSANEGVTIFDIKYKDSYLVLCTWEYFLLAYYWKVVSLLDDDHVCVDIIINDERLEVKKKKFEDLRGQFVCLSTNKTAKQIHEELKKYLDQDHRIQHIMISD